MLKLKTVVTVAETLPLVPLKIYSLASNILASLLSLLSEATLKSSFLCLFLAACIVLSQLKTFVAIVGKQELDSATLCTLSTDLAP